jgi:hypothetical protein
MGGAGEISDSLPPYAVIQPPDTGAIAATKSGLEAANEFVIMAPFEKPVMYVRQAAVP